MAMPVIQNESHQSASGGKDPRPVFGIGHITMPARNVALLRDFYSEVGMRLAVDMGQSVILEMRGGTHLIVHSGQGGQTSLDLIVDDVDATRDALVQAGAEASPIRRGNPHDSFRAIDPEGNELTIHSNHAMGPV